MAELNIINSWLGGHLITKQGFWFLASGNKTVSVCEIGCGGGDNLAVIYYWARKRGIDVFCIGIDINEDCITYARRQFPKASYIVGDYRSVSFAVQPDIIFSSLFCHHFKDEELVGQLCWMKANSRLGFFINDLHRNRLAYYSIKFLTNLFSSSRLVRNDAPLSVRRGFTRREWNQLLQEAGMQEGKIQWKWAFRWLVTVINET
ncbi:methyltransferase domain-containing protein [Flavihumibacter fluvii]|uniref:methyltransferase domain-containing protein n=1 Tax=Flavihumibacter fluvii TaxID=2838157 RepID=UPI001EFB1A80|nr:methyltransferase domain-containing protein [Flavihumibacter fluvii]ULQ52602.1 methyltransferase domain-containing protein [Flavihumibacter fluvii]